MIKYEKIEGMTTGQIIDFMFGDEPVYVKYDGEDFREIFLDTDVMIIDSYRAQGGLYTKSVGEWWGGFEDCLVMARDNDGEEWIFDVFVIYDKDKELHFRCKRENWKQARPLTAAERDAIKTVG